MGPPIYVVPRDPLQGSYAEPSVLESGTGYWVFAIKSGTLDFSGGGSKTIWSTDDRSIERLESSPE